jgi:hypothetical protein
MVKSTDRMTELLKLMEFDNIGMPIIYRNSLKPKAFLGFNYAKTSHDFEKTIHFFLDDYQFERVWNYPILYIPILKKFAGALSPDFSLYTGFPEPLCIYNTFRNRFLGALWQAKGITVLPTISWSDEYSFAYCFSGVEKKSSVAISTIGIKDDDADDLFRHGYQALLKAIDPEVIYIYGNELSGLSGEVVYFQSFARQSLDRRIKKWVDVEPVAGQDAVEAEPFRLEA